MLLDSVMPELKDTEWRLLCVIVRQTIGWSTGGGQRKNRDWLTQRQLMARTGRNSAALSAALDVLVRRRLVNAWDEAGELLLTPQERRRCRGRVYFGLCREALSGVGKGALKTALRKSKTTKEPSDKKEINKKLKVVTPQNGDTIVRIHTGWTRAGDVSCVD